MSESNALEIFSQGGEDDLLKYYDQSFDTLKNLIDRLYSIPGCGAGGICHIVTDDDNVMDDDLKYVIYKVIDDKKLVTCEGVTALSICSILLGLPYRKRVSFMNYYNGMRSLKDIIECSERQIEEELYE